MKRWGTAAFILATVASVPRATLAQSRGGQRGGGWTSTGHLVAQPPATRAPARLPVGGLRVVGGLPPFAKPMLPPRIAPAAPGFFARSPFGVFDGIGFCSAADNLFWHAWWPGIIGPGFSPYVASGFSPYVASGFSPYVASGFSRMGSPDRLPVGGLQLAVDPRRADVYVDGTYVGIVDDFSGYYHHLDLPAGPHQILMVTRGYDPLVIEVVITPGRTTTYRGTLTYSSGSY